MCAIAHNSYDVAKLGLVLSCCFEEELMVADRCENSRTKISKIPRRSLMSRFEIHRASDAGPSFGSFPHSRTAFLLILRAEGQEIFEGMSFAYSRLRQNHRRRSACIYAIPKCSAIGARE